MSSWIQETRTDTIQRCLCGLHRVISTRLESATVEFSEVAEKIRLPKKGSIMAKLVGVVAAVEGSSSAELTEYLNRVLPVAKTVSEVSSYLTLLKSNGLVTPLEVRRGMAGGSTWGITDACRELMRGRSNGS